MDLGFDEVQMLLKNSAREVLEQECPITLVRAMEEDERGFTSELWQNMAELGWLGLSIPEQYGGQGMSFFDLAILLEETGRFLVPGPFFSTVVLSSSILAEYGTESQKSEILPKIANGDLIATVAITEPSATYESNGIQLTATKDGSNYVLNGTKLFVNDAQIADIILVVAKTDDKGDESNGFTVFIVDKNTSGMTITPLDTIASDKQAEIVFESVSISEENVLGEVGKGWDIAKRVIDLGSSAKCIEMLGGADRVLEMTVEYVKDRTQFGRPIGSFQAIQHHCANMATDVEGCRYVAYHAVWRISEGLEAQKEISIAKAWVSDAYRRVCAIGHQSHGAIGFTKEYDLQLYTRRAKAQELAFGDSSYHREIVAQQLGI
ncbi:MAG: acyl-CoA dehydrogenase [SAR202 cluster bacterium]|nr:acyl-CoA dehydrogenase [SAR202 cluster bacterium]